MFAASPTQPDPGVPGPSLLRTGFHVEVDDAQAMVVLRLHGELDMATAEQLRTALVTAIAKDAPVIVLDVAGLSFMDSTGLSVIVAGWRQAEKAGRCLWLRNPSRLVGKVLRVTGFEMMLAAPPASGATG